MPATKAVMATWDVEDLTKELKDMELVAMRNKSSELLPKMLTALKAKVDGTQVITPSNFVKLSTDATALEESILPMEMKRELETCLETKAASSIQGATRLQTAPQSMTMPYNYLAQSEWKEIQSGCSTLDAITLFVQDTKKV